MDSNERMELVVRTAAKLTQEDRQRVAERILEETPVHRSDKRFAILLGIAEEAAGRPMRRTREWENVAIRRIVAYRMKQEGFHVSDIARALDLNHATILHYIRQMKDVFELPVYYHQDVELYTRFIELVDSHVEQVRE